MVNLEGDGVQAKTTENIETYTVPVQDKIEIPKGVDISKSQPKVFIAIPTTISRGVCPELTGFLLAYRKKFDDPKDPLNGIIGTSFRNDQSANNNLLAAKFLETDCTHYLKIDSDIVPYNGLVERMLELNKPAIACAVAIFREHIDGIMVCMYRGKKGNYEEIDFVKEPVGICDFAGGGVICIKREVLKSMNQPFWKLVYSEKDGDVEYPSDESFSKRVKELGFNFWYDASQILGQHHDIIIGGIFDGNCDRKQNIVLDFKKTGEGTIKFSKEGGKS